MYLNRNKMIRQQLIQCNKYESDLIKMRQFVRLSELREEAVKNAPLMASSILKDAIKDAPPSFMKTQLEKISR